MTVSRVVLLIHTMAGFNKAEIALLRHSLAGLARVQWSKLELSAGNGFLDCPSLPTKLEF